ncbi:MAG: haloacid dehalogenase-like hydrolase, partial [Anaerolineae bacterium]
LVGRPVGTKLDCVPPERRDEFGGRAATVDNARRAVELGADFLWLAGNPGTGASTDLIAQGVAEVANAIGDRVIIIAGKMHGAGLGRADVVSEEAIRRYAEAGADIIVVPAPGTVPGATLEYTKDLVEAIHAAGPLAMTGMGTSQEGADVETVRQIALMSKMTGADILHIGDAGFSGMAPPENIMAFSIAIRGQRHTYRRMALSLRR